MFSFWKKKLGLVNKKTKKDKVDELLDRAQEHTENYKALNSKDVVTGSKGLINEPKRPVLNVGEIKDRKDMMSVNRKRDRMDNNGQLLSDHEMLMIVTLNNFYLPNQVKGYYLECKEWSLSIFPKRSMHDIVWWFCNKIIMEMARFNLKKSQEFHKELENIRFNEKEEIRKK